MNVDTEFVGERDRPDSNWIVDSESGIGSVNA